MSNSDPVDTDALRETARKAGAAIAAVALNGGRIQMRVPADPTSDTDLLVAALECDALAAADEVDRLRAELVKAIRDSREATKTAEYERGRAEGYEREMNGLVAVVEDAPHDSGCQFSFLPRTSPRRCTCWKADALPHPSTP